MRNPGNYRLVSLTSAPGISIEIVIKNKVIKHLGDQDLIGTDHHGV